MSLTHEPKRAIYEPNAGKIPRKDPASAADPIRAASAAAFAAYLRCKRVIHERKGGKIPGALTNQMVS